MLLKFLYLIAAIDILLLVFFILDRLITNIGDKKISNVFDQKLKYKKKSLNKKIISSMIVLVITVLCILVYGRYAILIMDFMGDTVSPLWEKLVCR